MASGSSFSWPEVGVLGLTPRLADGDYLGSGDVADTGILSFNRSDNVIISNNITAAGGPPS